MVLASSIKVPNVTNTITATIAMPESSGTVLDDFGVEETSAEAVGEELAEDDVEGVLEEVEVGTKDVEDDVA